MQKKIFWLSFITLDLLTGFLLPFVWGVILTFPLLFLCWWVAYKSGWFD